MHADDHHHRVPEAEWERLKREARDRAQRQTESESPRCADGEPSE